MSEVAVNPTALPSSWTLTTLGAVVSYGRTRKVEPNEIANGDWVLELEDVEKDSSRLLQKMTFLQRQSKSTKNRFEAGDVLYGKLRPYLNKVLIADEPGYCTTEILPLRAGTNLDNRYLFYWLKHPAFLKYVEAESHGMNMPRLGTAAGRAAPFVLAPKNEQTRIANQLDTLIKRIQSCRDRLEAIPHLLKRFRQVIANFATDGQLSGDWRKYAAPELWKSVRLEEVCDSITDGDHQAPEQTESGIPFITISAINDGELRLEKATRYVNVINQGLFYLDWLMDHKAEFKLLVLDKLGAVAADAIDWSAPRVVCIAADFTKYDNHAVQQIGRNIDLIRYRRFGEDLLLLESVNVGADTASKTSALKNAKASGSKTDAVGSTVPAPTDSVGAKGTGPDKSFAELLPTLSESMKLLLASLEDYTLSLGDDVQRKELRLYAAFKRLKNFATVVLHRRTTYCSTCT